MKKAVKKIISLLLITILVFSALPITVSAAETSTDIPEYVDYQAGRYSKQFNMIFGDGSDSFANTYYKTMKNNESVISGVAIWEAAHIVTSPSYALDSGLISKKDTYKLAIFDMLDITESSTFASNLANVLQDERLSYIVSVTKAVCDPQDIKVSELKNFEVTGEYINFLEEGAKNAKALDVAGNIQKIVDVCDNLYEAVNTIATYQTISNMKNGYAEILEAIAKDDKNPWDLREAANDCVVYTNKSFDTTLSRLINNPELFTNPTIESVLKLSVDYLWDIITSAIPGGTVVLTAASGMRVLSNAVFKMDDTCRTYYELETDVNLENAVRRVMDNSKYDFTQNKSRDNATSYMQAVNMYKRVVLQGYDYVINMLEVKASAPATQWFDWFNHDYSECIKLIDDIGNSKETKKHLYDQFEEWVLDDYNKLYQSDYNKTINAFNNQQTLHASSVSLSQIKEIHSGDNGYIYDYIKKTCQPENSTEYKKCFFTADNKDIFTIDKLGSFVAESAGHVTLTYDKGGELETSITITIGESSKKEPYDYLSDFEYSVYNERVTITGYNGTRSNLIIPGEIKGYRVTSIGGSAFEGCSSLTSINIPDGVTSIGYDVFRDCTNLTSINIPDGVTSIGDLAFYGCSSLTSINIPDGVTSIGDWTFNGCSSLTSINIPYGVTSIGDLAFYGCSSLSSINIPDGVTSIGEYAFSGCSSLSSINIPNGVTKIGDEAFYDCRSLTSINIPDGVTSIGYSAFYGCSSLTSINIPDGVTSIGDWTFNGCSSLTSINIPNGVTSIGLCAFSGCSSLTSITIPDGVTSIGDGAFGDCSSLTKTNYTGTIDKWTEIYFVSGDSNPTNYSRNLYINNQLVTKANLTTATKISNYAFKGCTSLTSINIPDSVTSIGDGAFSGCSSLTGITIPDGVTSIGLGAFNDCSSLTSINIPDGVTSIDNWTFGGCSSLTGITIPNGVTSIGEYAFYDCTSLTSINIPDGVTSIGYDVFKDCTNLTSINIPDGVTSIRSSAFRDCSSLTSITIPNSVTSIEYGAFYRCSSLTSITIPNSVTSIGNQVFRDCTNLTSITIPDGVTSIGEYAFCDCSSLTSINIPDGVTSIGNWTFGDCSSLTSITIPNSVTSIGDSAFGDCSSLTSITIPDGVASIGNWTFGGCSSLTSITIPDGVTSIGEGAFRDCSSLISINIPDGVTKIGDGAFYDCTSLTGITIPNGVTEIGDSAFEDCTSLTSITIPDGVTSIGNDAFYGCHNLSDVFYSNSDTEWSNISIGSGNDYLASANIHYNTSSDDYSETSRTEADCTTDGVIEYKCPHGYTKTEKIPAYGHNFINGICSRCGKNELECFESAHPYEDNCDKSWTINKPGAKSVSITFSSQTKVEDGYDYIEIYDGKDNLIGSYTGTALASQCITVTGDTVRIRLTSDSSNSYYGFSIDSIDYVAEPNALSVGDVNGDGEITILDATCIQKYIAQLEDFTDKQKEVADVNGDGTISVMDSTQIQKYIVQLIDTLG